MLWPNWCVCDDASAPQREAFFNLHRVVLKALGQVVDLVDEHDIATLNGDSFSCPDGFAREDTFFMSGGNPDLEFCV
jgi:hypothetical protein